MAPESFRFTGQELSNDLIASIAHLLDRRHIPNVLWGNYLLTVYGVPSLVDGADFIIPDNLVPAATSILLSAGFYPCKRGRECINASDTTHHRGSPAPMAHVHMTDDLYIKFYPKSKIFRNMKVDFEVPSDYSTSSNIVLASDTRILRTPDKFQNGAFSKSLHPVRIPSTHCYTQTCLLLAAQDSTYATFWLSMINYVCQYIDEKGRLDRSKLEPRCKKFYLDIQNPTMILRNSLKNFKTSLEPSSST